MQNPNKRKKSNLPSQIAKWLKTLEKVDKSNPDRLQLDYKKSFYRKKT